MEKLKQNRASDIDACMSNFSSYSTNETENHPDFDPNWFEASHKGPISDDFLGSLKSLNNNSVRDLDNDGYLEINAETLESAFKMGLVECRTSLPLVPFFDDSLDVDRDLDNLFVRTLMTPYHLMLKAAEMMIGVSFTENMEIKSLIGKPEEIDRLENVDPYLKESLFDYNYEESQFYLEDLSVHHEHETLEYLMEPLAQIIGATMVHVGMDYSDNQLVDGPNGLSVVSDGRLRTDCGGFANFAHMLLKNIEGLNFMYVILDNGDADALPSVIGGARLVCNYTEGCKDISKIRCAQVLKYDIYRGVGIALGAGTNNCVQTVLHGGRPRIKKGCDETTWTYEGEVWRCSMCFDDSSKRDLLIKKKPVSIDEVAPSIRNEINAKYPSDIVMFCENPSAAYDIWNSPNDNILPAAQMTTRMVSFSKPTPYVMDNIDAHMLLVVSKGNSHLLIDNEVVVHTKNNNIWAWLKESFSSNFSNFRRRPEYIDTGKTETF